MRFGDAPGAFGQLVESQTLEPVSGGRVCLLNEPENCSNAGNDGRFKLPPRTHERWMFIMVETFPEAAQGVFVAEAAGFERAQFTADFLRSVTVSLTRKK
jgi:hypothetical protein